MTITETPLGTADTPEAREALITLIGETAGALLPADEGWTPQAATDVLPPQASAAVGCKVADHAITIVAAAAMDRRIMVGPPPAEGLLDGATPAVQAITEALGIGTPGEVHPVDVGNIVNELTDDSLICALLDGDNHLVTVIVTPPPAEDDLETATFEPIAGTGVGGVAQSGLEVLHDVEMGVTVELGRTRMPLRDILSVVPGSVIELDRAASAPVDVLVNGTLIARGEVVVIDEEFGIRITEIVGHEQTIHDEATA